MKLKSVIGRYLIRSGKFPWLRIRGNRYLNVRMDTTNRCNLRCSMCPMRLSDDDPTRDWHNISPELFSKIARELFPVSNSVSLSCGAEPLMNPNFMSYLKTLYECDVPVREFVTNGILLTEDIADRILETPPTSLFVSIDGAVQETHSAIRGGADLNTIVSNLKYLSKQRAMKRQRYPKISFSVTLQKKNIKELSGIVELAAKVGADSVAFVPLVPYEGLDVSSEVVNLKSERVAAEIEKASLIAKDLGILLSVAQGGAKRTGTGCPYLSGWIFIDPDGRVNPCPYWNTSNPLGDFSDDNFEVIWNNEAYSELRHNVQAGIFRDICAVCPERSGSRTSEIKKTD